jgi:hypothetical protein
VYTRCIRCDRSLGRNSEIPHLRVGKRIAFDVISGRVWVICKRCDQWNLVPVEERWEQLAECEQAAANAESKATTTGVGLARTASGLELLRVGGMTAGDIANWKYGRRLIQRQRLLFWIAGAFATLALLVGVRAGLASGSAPAGVYVAVVALVWLGFLWGDPPRVSPTIVYLNDERVLIWPWQLRDIELRGDGDGAAGVVIPGRRMRQFTGGRAVRLLAKLLPKLNGSDCATASVRAAVGRVDRAEREERSHDKSVHRKKPGPPDSTQRVPAAWERLAPIDGAVRLLEMPAEHRLALEIAVTEELEQRELMVEAEIAGAEVAQQQAIAGIADKLIEPSEP